MQILCINFQRESSAPTDRSTGCTHRSVASPSSCHVLYSCLINNSEWTNIRATPVRLLTTHCQARLQRFVTSLSRPTPRPISTHMHTFNVVKTGKMQHVSTHVFVCVKSLYWFILICIKNKKFETVIRKSNCFWCKHAIFGKISAKRKLLILK